MFSAPSSVHSCSNHLQCLKFLNYCIQIIMHASLQRKGGKIDTFTTIPAAIVSQKSARRTYQRHILFKNGVCGFIYYFYCYFLRGSTLAWPCKINDTLELELTFKFWHWISLAWIKVELSTIYTRVCIPFQKEPMNHCYFDPKATIHIK